MGMSASQARLLTLTARIHDIEYQAQSIQNAKLQLATQSDQVYNEYLAALDATTMTITAIDDAGSKSTVAATFNNLCSKNQALTAADGSIYVLKDSRGRLIVEDDVADAYANYNGANAAYGYAEGFAMFMLTGKTSSVIEKVENGEDVSGDNQGIDTSDDPTLQTYKQDILDLMTSINPSVTDFYDVSSIVDFASDEQMTQYNQLVKKFRNRLYSNHADKVYAELIQPAIEDLNQDDFNYYVNVYNQIQAAGGRCVSIKDFDGSLANSDAASNSEWLQAMVECGKISISKVKKDNYTGVTTLNATSPSSDISLAYTETTTIDKTALAKAEAKYNHDLKQIDKKDKQFDLDLSKLETERNALKQQLEATKKVIDDNIKRTFNIFGGN